MERKHSIKSGCLVGNSIPTALWDHHIQFNVGRKTSIFLLKSQRKRRTLQYLIRKIEILHILEHKNHIIVSSQRISIKDSGDMNPRQCYWTVPTI